MATFTIVTNARDDRLLKWQVDLRNAEIRLHNNMVNAENQRLPSDMPKRALMSLVTELDFVNDQVRQLISTLENQYKQEKSREVYERLIKSDTVIKSRILSDLGVNE